MSTKEEIIAAAEIIDAELARLRKIERQYNKLKAKEAKNKKQSFTPFTLTREELKAISDEHLKQYETEWQTFDERITF